jgi:two-component system sensor histidine kinase UhpB
VLVNAAFLLVGLFGAALAVQNARDAVVEELDSSVKLTLELIEVALAGSPEGDHGVLIERLRASLAAIEGTRHLTLTIEGGTAAAAPPVAEEASAAPAWFARWLEVEPVQYRRLVSLADGADAVLVIRADPRDEIDEAWADARALIVVLLLALLMADLLVVLTVTHALRPVHDIQRALDAVERGDLAARLPTLGLPELDGIARQFNHMVSVLESSREENRRLTSRSLSIQERERRHLAQELHDEMGQSLSAIRAIAASMMRRAGEADAHTRDAAQEIARIGSHVYDVARGMMHRLRPVTLDELGLKAAIETLVDDWNARFEDCFCRLELGPLPERLPDDLAIGAYRIVQEALTNVVKHARATEVAVSVRTRPGPDGSDLLELRIRDNGRGLAAGALAGEGGLGLRGMRERAEVAGGRLRLVEPAGGGLQIEVELPCASSGEHERAASSQAR